MHGSPPRVPTYPGADPASLLETDGHRVRETGPGSLSQAKVRSSSSVGHKPSLGHAPETE